MNLSLRLSEVSLALEEVVGSCKLAGADGIVLPLSAVRARAGHDPAGGARAASLAIEVPLQDDVLAAIEQALELQPQAIVLLRSSPERSVFPPSSPEALRDAAAQLSEPIRRLAEREVPCSLRVFPDRAEVELAHAFGAKGVRLDADQVDPSCAPATEPVHRAVVRARELGLTVEVCARSPKEAFAASAVGPIDSLVIDSSTRALRDPANLAKHLRELRASPAC